MITTYRAPVRLHENKPGLEGHVGLNMCDKGKRTSRKKGTLVATFSSIKTTAS